eukprot:TRINITY_DN3262_c0_g1_i2.p1 TRINITY_DN3262_c0_g1~~TRINITY_DN3262_c0_g1_i2.p1  ORF type:complete len:413 (+),score=81.87 TRINITY_DN3262_c0_g1_i2:708-1946(+)
MVKRLSQLTPYSKAVILDALQKVGFSTVPNVERHIADIFCSTSKESLTLLKNLCDAGGTHRDLQRLIFFEMRSAQLREKIVNHFQSEANKFKDYKSELKILSDIDDTLCCKLYDRRWPWGTIYPGVRQFYRELDIEKDEAGRVGDLVFLTARPSGYKGIVENSTHALLKSSGLHTQPSILAGATTHFLGNSRMAVMKSRNFGQYAQLYPEYRFAFIGDSGQGDVALAEMMLKEEKIKLEGVFIHDINGTPTERQVQLKVFRIFFFTNYSAAGAYAYQIGLIGFQGLLRIFQGSIRETKAVSFSARRKNQQAARLRDLYTVLLTVQKHSSTFVPTSEPRKTDLSIKELIHEFEEEFKDLMSHEIMRGPFDTEMVVLPKGLLKRSRDSPRNLSSSDLLGFQAPNVRSPGNKKKM